MIGSLRVNINFFEVCDLELKVKFKVTHVVQDEPAQNFRPVSNIMAHSLPSADSRRAVVSFWRKNVHNTG